MKKLNKEVIDQIIKSYKSGNSSRVVAKEFGVSKTTVLEYVNPKTYTDEELKLRQKKNNIAVTKRRKKIKLMCVEYMGGKCVKCTYNKCIAALEFHHLDPNEKDFGIGQFGHTRSWEKVKKELDKCIMVCSNCHREIHEEQMLT